MDEYTVGMGSRKQKVRAPSVEAAVVWHARQVNLVKYIGLQALAFIVVYEINGKKYNNKTPFALRDPLDYMPDEFRQIMADVKTCEAV